MFPSPSMAQCVCVGVGVGWGEGTGEANISGILPEAYGKALDSWTLQGERLHAALEIFL